MKVWIPFLERFREPMINGIKTYTSRNKRYGGYGDTFDAFGKEFQLLEVRKVSLFYVMYHLYREEGAGSRDEFVDIWKKIHPRKGFNPDQIVWLHHFTLLTQK